MSTWRADKNEKARARLSKALPAVFPGAVLRHALSRPLIPPTPRRAVEGYWRAHPFRADRLARALARRHGAPEGWTWRLDAAGEGGRRASFRAPPAPYREPAFARGPGHCCICGGPVFRFGWHRDLWGTGPNRRAGWHSACVAAWRFWCDPAEAGPLLRRAQGRRCPESGRRLLRGAEIDHRVPLFRVWREHRDRPWPDLLAFWGRPNLRAVNRDSHRQKCADEAGSRAAARAALRDPPMPAGDGRDHASAFGREAAPG